MGHLKSALRQRLGKTSTNGHVHSDEAGGREVRIEAGEQFEVEPTIGCEIQCACAGEFDRAVHAEVSTLPHEVELLDVDRLIGEGESNGILIMELYIFDIERNCTQVAGEDPLPGLAEWATQVERTGDGRMSRELAAEIGDPESVEIDLVRLKGQVGGIVIAQPNLAADQQRAVLELRIAGEMQFATLRDAMQVEITGKFIIDREAEDVDVRIDGGRVGSTRGFENEAGAPVDRDTIRMDLSDLGEVEIVPHEVELKGTGGRIISGAPGHD